MTSLSIPIENNETLHCIMRFLAVGFLGTVLDIGLFTFLNVGMGLAPLPANTLSYSTGGVNNFILHRYWTFGQRARKAAGGQFLQFAIVSIGALILNNLLVLVLAPAFHSLLSQPGYDGILAKLCATGTGMCWNFLANNLWTFRTGSSAS